MHALGVGGGGLLYNHLNFPKNIDFHNSHKIHIKSKLDERKCVDLLVISLSALNSSMNGLYMSCQGSQVLKVSIIYPKLIKVGIISWCSTTLI